jgi:hypothetical protein
MTYGIEIRNNSDRVIIDEGYSNLYIVNETASLAAVGSAYPTTNYGSDLIVARPYINQNGLVSLCTSGGLYWANNATGVGTAPANTNASYNYSLMNTPKPPQPTSGFNYHSLRKVQTNQTAPTSGFGFVVYDSTGTNAQFSATSSDKYASIVSIGNLSGTPVVASPTGSPTTWSSLISLLETNSESQMVTYYPSSTGVLTNLSSYFCCVSTTYRNHINIPENYGSAGQYRPDRSFDRIQGYEYIWTGADQGRIRIVNFRASTTISSGTTTTTYSSQSPLDYIIFRITG